MDSASSSEDECNLYVNAASVLKAMSEKNKKNEDQISNLKEDSEDSETNYSPTLPNASKRTRRKNQCIVLDEDSKDDCTDSKIQKLQENDDICCIIDDEEEKCENRLNICNKEKGIEDDAVMCIDVLDSGKPATTKQLSRLESEVNLFNSIEEELNNTYNDSFNLSQDENDSYVVIGSPIAQENCKPDNYNVSVKVLWKSTKIERFDIQRYETFQKVFLHFANLEGVPQNRILITKNNKNISPFDTPISIDWSILDILDGGVVSAEVAKESVADSNQLESDHNVCKIKVQTSDKRTLSVTIKNNQSLVSLIPTCANQLNIPEENIKLYFDGELITADETPESLDFDDEACIDLKITK